VSRRNNVKQFCLYSIRNTANGKGYIGQTVMNPPERRWKQHLRVAKSGSIPLYRSMRKHEFNKFAFEPMMIFESQAELDAAEIHMITACNTLMPKGHGYNCSLGGESRGTVSHTEEAKIRMRMAKSTPEAREYFRRLQIGRKASPETRAKMSAWHRLPENRERARAAKLGTRAPKNIKEKLSRVRLKMYAKGRLSAEGRSAILSAVQVREIYETGKAWPRTSTGRLTKGLIPALVERFGVKKSVLSSILSGKHRTRHSAAVDAVQYTNRQLTKAEVSEIEAIGLTLQRSKTGRVKRGVLETIAKQFGTTKITVSRIVNKSSLAMKGV